MATNDTELTPKQWSAIRALITSPSISAAASVSGVGERTLHRWLQENKFRDALTEVESAALDSVTRRLLTLTTKALETVESILDDDAAHPGLRLKASEMVLSHMLKLRDQWNIEQRLRWLEKAKGVYDDEQI